MIRLRRFRAEDTPEAFALFYRAVHEGAVEHYTEAERAAWAPTRVVPEGWPARLGDAIT